jgi:hypothetical protein
MFILDTLLLSPIYATVWAARQIHNTIQQEREAEPAQITAELSELYMRLEAGQISEPEFDAREKELLDRLDQLQAEETGPGQSAEEKARRGKPANAPSKPRKSARK